MKLGDAPQLVHRARDLLDLTSALGDEFRHCPVEYRMEYLVLAFEIQIDSAVGYAGLTGNVRDLGVEITFARKDLYRRTEDGFTFIDDIWGLFETRPCSGHSKMNER